MLSMINLVVRYTIWQKISSMADVVLLVPVADIEYHSRFAFEISVDHLWKNSILQNLTIFSERVAKQNNFIQKNLKTIGRSLREISWAPARTNVGLSSYTNVSNSFPAFWKFFTFLGKKLDHRSFIIELNMCLSTFRLNFIYKV